MALGFGPRFLVYLEEARLLPFDQMEKFEFSSRYFIDCYRAVFFFNPFSLRGNSSTDRFSVEWISQIIAANLFTRTRFILIFISSCVVIKKFQIKNSLSTLIGLRFFSVPSLLSMEK